jgi:trimeric autotransporter adhesin
MCHRAFLRHADHPLRSVVTAFTILALASTTRPALSQTGAWADVGGGVGDFEGFIQSLEVHNDGTGEALYVGGTFLTAGGQPASHIARWDGQSWLPVGEGIPGPGGPQGAPTIMDLEVFDDGSGGGPRLYACGSWDGVPNPGVLFVWDGRTWSTIGAPFDDFATCMAVFDDGSGPALYLGGLFDSVDGQSVSNLAKWDGKTWSDVGGGVDGELAMVMDMLVWDDGSGPGLVVAGAFEFAGAGAGAIAANDVARWRDGTWSTFGQDGLPFPGTPYARCLAAWPPEEESSLIVGGWFFESSDTFSGLALWNGVTWQDIAPALVDTPGVFLQPGAYALHAMRVGECNQLFMNGGYDNNSFHRWNGEIWRGMGNVTSSYWFLASPRSTTFTDFATFQNRLYMGGSFTSLEDVPLNNIAVWDPFVILECAADGNQDGDINVDDLIAVILQWGPCDDCTGDNAPCGGDGDVNVDDLTGVILGWGPCP